MAHIEITESMMSNIVRRELRDLRQITIEARDELLAKYGDTKPFEREDIINFELEIAAIGLVLDMYQGDM